MTSLRLVTALDGCVFCAPLVLASASAHALIRATVAMNRSLAITDPQHVSLRNRGGFFAGLTLKVALCTLCDRSDRCASLRVCWERQTPTWNGAFSRQPPYTPLTWISRLAVMSATLQRDGNIHTPSAPRYSAPHGSHESRIQPHKGSHARPLLGHPLQGGRSAPKLR